MQLHDLLRVQNRELPLLIEHELHDDVVLLLLQVVLLQEEELVREEETNRLFQDLQSLVP